MSGHQDPSRLSRQNNEMQLYSHQAHFNTLFDPSRYDREPAGFAGSSTHFNHNLAPFTHQGSTMISQEYGPSNNNTSSISSQYTRPGDRSGSYLALPGPVTPRMRRSNSYHSHHYNHPFNPTTPTRSTYLEHISPLRYPGNSQTTPNRHISFQRLPSLFQPSMDNTGQAEGGVNVNTTYRDNADASMDITTRDHADGSMGITSRGNASASMGIPTKGSVCDEQCAPRRVPSLAELPDNSQLTMGEQTAPLRLSGGGGLRRMSSTPAMFSRAVPMSESSNGTTLNYSHPAAISQTSSAGDAPVRDEVAEFLQIM